MAKGNLYNYHFVTILRTFGLVLKSALLYLQHKLLSVVVLCGTILAITIEVVNAMKGKGLIIINAADKSGNTQYKVNRMSEQLRELGVDTEVVTNDHFLCYVDRQGIVSRAKQYDFALFFDKDKYVSYMLEATGLRLFNSARAIELCDDKMSTHIELAKHGIPMPTTLAGALCYTDDAVIDDKYLQRAQQMLGFPMVVKQCYGSYGKQVELISNSEQLRQTVERIKTKPYLFQQYVGYKKGQDTRIIVVGGKVCCAMQRVSNGDFRSNIELGGIGYVAKLNDDFVAIAERASDILGLDYCGIDILTDKDGSPLVCEVNSNAMFGGIERVTGVNVAQAFALHITKQVYGK